MLWSDFDFQLLTATICQIGLRKLIIINARQSHCIIKCFSCLHLLDLFNNAIRVLQCFIVESDMTRLRPGSKSLLLCQPDMTVWTRFDFCDIHAQTQIFLKLLGIYTTPDGTSFSLMLSLKSHKSVNHL